MYVIEYRVGQELPDLAVNWPDDNTGLTADLSTGWTGSVRFAHVDRPNTLLSAATVTTGITLAATPPNFVAAWSTTVWSALVTAWGRTLPEEGTWFDVRPHLVRNGDSKDRPWQYQPIRLRLRPQIA